jgi:hypothetical protein
VVEKVEMEMRQRAVAGVDLGGRHSLQSTVDSPKGKARLDTDKALPGVPPQEGAVEVDALETQRMEMPADVPEKITYR